MLAFQGDRLDEFSDYLKVKIVKAKGMLKTAFQEPNQVKHKRFEEDFLSVQN